MLKIFSLRGPHRGPRAPGPQIWDPFPNGPPRRPGGVVADQGSSANQRATGKHKATSSLPSSLTGSSSAAPPPAAKGLRAFSLRDDMTARNSEDDDAIMDDEAEYKLRINCNLDTGPDLSKCVGCEYA